MPPEVRPIGHNNPPAHDPDVYARFEGEIAALNERLAKIRARGEIETEEQAEEVNDLVSEATKLARTIDTERKRQKEPWDEKVTEVQSAYKLLATKADNIKKGPGGLLREWLDKAAKRQAEKRLAEIERLEKERARIVHDLANADARYDTAGAAELKTKIEKTDRELRRLGKAPKKASVGSATGAANRRSVRKVRSAKITSVIKLLMHFKEHPDVIEVLQRLANAAVRDRSVDESQIPGIEVVEEEKVV